MAVVEFDLRTPLNGRAIRRHIRHARSLRLPEALTEPEALTVIANGPSAWQAPQAPLGAPTLALNGALKVCQNPTYYAACDPQELVAGFLDKPPKDTIYYIASKCHPRVFAALRGRDVRLWHVADYVPGGIPTAPSITLTALSLFIRLGWRKFNVYGWDACYQNGKHHSTDDSPHNGDKRAVVVGDKTFQTTPTWAAEAQDAIYMLALFDFLGIEVVIHGDSMIKAIRAHRSAAA